MAEPVDIHETPREAVEDNRLTREFIENVREAVDTADAARVRELVGPLHEADIADLLEQIDDDHRQPLAALLGDVLNADVLAEMNEWVRDELIDVLEPHQVADVVQQMETDDAVAIIEELDAEEQREVLRSLPAPERAVLEEALSYPEESAGRLMQRDLIAVPEHWTVGKVIDFVRDNPDQAEDFWEIFVVDPAHKPVGTMKLSSVLRTPRSVPVAEIMAQEQTLIPVEMDQEEVALRFQKYALISAAVVDGNGRLVGVITVDDIVHVISQEASEDMLRMSGAGDEGDINEPVVGIYKQRVRWLIANLGTALVASFVIRMFEGTIEQMVALATLMPIVASIGGNAGTQTMAVAVRAIATDQLTEANTKRTIIKEIRVALLNGATIAALIGVGVGLVFGNPALGGVIAAAMMINILIAGLAGVFVPLTLDRIGADPAVASSVFVTMTTDTMGFLCFLGLASAVFLPG